MGIWKVLDLSWDRLLILLELLLKLVEHDPKIVDLVFQ